MNVLWIIFNISLILASPEEKVEWNYPYYTLQKFLMYITPLNGQEYFNADGTYHFRYDTGIAYQQSFRGETRDHTGTVRGYYGYIDEGGVMRITEYTSDNFGYRARTTLRYHIFSDGK